MALPTLALAVLAVLPAAVLPGCGPDERSADADESLQEIYEQGVTFQDFLEQATRRKNLWTEHYVQGAVPEDILERARAVDGTWRILAIAEDWCSDSVNTIPFLALLADAAPALELRVVDSEVGEAIMELHLTPDGRPATPTVLVLDRTYEEVGCWVERPSSLQAWALENRERLGDDFMPQKMAWYKEDAGRSTMEEVLAVIEAAAAGQSVCVKG
jgi:hypothetical protein